MNFTGVYVSVSALTIRVMFFKVFGYALPDTLPYVDAGERLVCHLGVDNFSAMLQAIESGAMVVCWDCEGGNPENIPPHDCPLYDKS